MKIENVKVLELVVLFACHASMKDSVKVSDQNKSEKIDQLSSTNVFLSSLILFLPFGALTYGAIVPVYDV